MRTFTAAILLACLIAPASAPAGAVAQPSGDPVTGLWINPYHSVAVRNHFCGNALCGQVVWASPDAQADAHESGVSNLIGLDLLQNYHAHSPGTWKGVALVPDMGRKFSSQIEVLSPSRIRISGCILHGLICKSQVWTRIGELPR